MLDRSVDILIIGAGQAGLALGYHLRRTEHRVRIVERNARVGDSWRHRYDSLTLFTPRAYSALPGLAVPGDSDGYPGKDEIADYLDEYARCFDLPVATGTGIRSLTQVDGIFRARTDAGELIDARTVVSATGAFQRPAVPAIARQMSADVQQFTPESYKHPGQIPPGQVAVVGDGATGRQIARELAASHDVLLSTGRPRRVIPERILGRSAFWWMDKLGALRASRETPLGRYLMHADPFPGKDLSLGRLRRHGVRVVGRLLDVARAEMRFADGETAEVAAVIWATGYTEDARWVAIPEAKDTRSGLAHWRGVSPVAGLYVIGRSWQWSRGSALVAGVGADAAYVARRIDAQLSGRRTAWDDVARRSGAAAVTTARLRAGERGQNT